MDTASKAPPFYLGRYNCVESIGQGPLGETFRAKIYGVAGFEKQFAVKRLPVALSADETFVAQFVSATNNYAALNHERIAHVHEVNAQGEEYYLAVDLVRGLDVKRVVEQLAARGEKLSRAAILLLGLDIAEALAYAHSRVDLKPQGVLHLGLTPRVIMLTQEGEVRLLDFGLLFPLRGRVPDDALMPTFAYSAPELLRGEPGTAQSDVFSLGVVLYELCTGHRPFAGESATLVRAIIESGQHSPLEEEPAIVAIVERALKTSAEERFATAGELAEALRRVLGDGAHRARSELLALARRLLGRTPARTGSFAALESPIAARPLQGPGASAASMSAPSVRTWTPPPLPKIGSDSVPNPARTSSPPVEGHPPIVGERQETGSLPETSSPEASPSVGAEDSTLMPIEINEITSPVAPNPELPSVAETGTLEAFLSGLYGGATSDPALEAEAPLQDVAEYPPDVVNGGEVGLFAVSERYSHDLDSGPTMVELVAAAAPELVAPPAALPQPRFPMVNAPLGDAVAKSSSWPELPPDAAAAAYVRAELAEARSRSSHRRLYVPVALAMVIGSGAFALFRPRSAPPRSTPAWVAKTEASPRSATAPAEPPPLAHSMVAVNARALGKVEAPATTPSTSAAIPTGASGPSPDSTAKPAAVADSPQISVASTPPGASVYLDGEPKGTTPTVLPVARGSHKVVLASPGFVVWRRTVTIKPTGTSVDATLVVAKLPAEAAGPAGLKVRCRTQNEFRIFVDDSDTGVDCPNEERISVQPGTHKIGLLSLRTEQMHELEQMIANGNHSTRVYVKY